MLTDNGTVFANQSLREVCTQYGIFHTTTPPYHPQANPVERVNRILKTMIVSFVDENHQDWDLHLAEFRFAYNTAFHSSIGMSPAFLNFGRTPRPHQFYRRVPCSKEVIPRDIVKWSDSTRELTTLRDRVRHNLELAYQRQAANFDKHRTPGGFKVGDFVCRK